MSESRKYEDKIPFRFVLDYLTSVDFVIKPMFGCHGIYANGRLCLFLMNRERPLTRREAEPMQKGVYIATTTDHMDDLKKTFAYAEFELLTEKKVWIFVSEASRNFEQYVIRACEMISSGDARIGR
jgi:hypothetical protein